MGDELCRRVQYLYSLKSERQLYMNARPLDACVNCDTANNEKASESERDNDSKRIRIVDTIIISERIFCLRDGCYSRHMRHGRHGVYAVRAAYLVNFDLYHFFVRFIIIFPHKQKREKHICPLLHVSYVCILLSFPIVSTFLRIHRLHRKFLFSPLLAGVGCPEFSSGTLHVAMRISAGITIYAHKSYSLEDLARLTRLPRLLLLLLLIKHSK